MTSSKERFTGFLIFVVAVAAFGGFLFGYHTGIISGALIYLAPAFQLTIAKQGMVVSVILLGALLGSFFGGSLADRIGRKRTIALTSFLFAIGAALIALSQSYEMLLVGRFVDGIGVGLISICGPIYLAEISPPSHRGTFVSLYQLAITVGFLVSFLVSYALSSSADWKWMFAIGITPALLQMFALFFLPETPAWLIKHGHLESAKNVFERLRKDRTWEHHLKELERSASPQKHGDWRTLFSHRLRYVLVIGTLLSALQQISGINTIYYFAPKIFETAGFASASGALLATLGIGVINVLFTLIAAWILDKVGRRALLLIGTAGMAVSLLAFSLISYFHTSAASALIVISLMAYAAFFAFSLGPVTWVVVSEIFPMQVRGKAMTVALAANWICNYFVSLSFLYFIQWVGLHGTFFFYTLICAIGIWFVFRFIPETKGKSLEEIETLLLR